MPPPAGAAPTDIGLDDAIVTPMDTEPSAPAPARARAPRLPWRPEDIVDEWGAQSFPASDPPANW